MNRQSVALTGRPNYEGYNSKLSAHPTVVQQIYAHQQLFNQAALIGTTFAPCRNAAK